MGQEPLTIRRWVPVDGGIRDRPPGFYRGFTDVGRTLADVEEFTALVRWCERTGKLECLSEMHPPGF